MPPMPVVVQDFFHQQNVPLASANSELKQNRTPWKTEIAHLGQGRRSTNHQFLGFQAVSFSGGVTAGTQKCKFWEDVTLPETNISNIAPKTGWLQY